ncbi:hypothetical protein HDU98_010695 [Podochytrium sp. JEL0797]|nr:hypothetical protein HDU98_010695 [Podochytrium sp. JEL0797]
MITTLQMLRTIRSDLHALGMDLLTPFCVDTYNSHCLTGTAGNPAPLPALPTFPNRTHTLGILVANTKHLWPIFTAHVAAHKAEVLAAKDPLDDYVRDGITRIMERQHIKYDVRFTWETDTRFVHFQRLAHHIGAAFFDPISHLSVTDEFGPWMAFRAVIVLDMEYPEGGDDAELWDALGAKRPVSAPIMHPCPELEWAVAEKMKMFFQAAKEYSNRSFENHKYLIAARDAGTSEGAKRHRYSKEQIQYHYTKDKQFLGDLGQ